VSVEKMAAMWQPLLKQLEKSTGLKFVQKYAKDFDEFTKMCQDGAVDFAYSNPVIYVQSAYKPKDREAGHKAFAIAMTAKGSNDFYGLFVIRADNDKIKSLADIKGKKGWITGKTSAAGFIFQQAYAMDNGIDMWKDCQLTESPGNKQEKVVGSVLNKLADFGTVRNGMLEVMKDQVDVKQLRVLAETPKYPAWVLSAGAGVKPETAEKVRKAFLNLPKAMLLSAQLPGKVEGFVPAKESDFDMLKKTLEKTGVPY
jgi:phosphonate transport system substrate-binding protein